MPPLQTSVQTISLDAGWEVLQDVHSQGETLGIWRQSFRPETSPGGFSPWELIDRLDYLQLLFSDSPYHGRHLRYFNQAPWWYRTSFACAPCAEDERVYLAIHGADYFSKVWLNDCHLGEHEGYFDTFSFDITEYLSDTHEQYLVIQVSSPWDSSVAQNRHHLRFTAVERNMVKGTYEHADTFIQRDVNPVGIWGSVSVSRYRGARFSRDMQVTWDIQPETRKGSLRITADLAWYQSSPLEAAAVLLSPQGLEIAAHTEVLEAGTAAFTWNTIIDEVQLWDVWDRGEAYLYAATLVLGSQENPHDACSTRFGIRSIELERSPDLTRFMLNGRALFLRGTNYFPEIYCSRMSRLRYRRDLMFMKQAGFNAIRVHVHVEQRAFYELCDELGMMVMQDSDLNWSHPDTPEFAQRAAGVFSQMAVMLRGYSSICCWVCVNEPDLWRMLDASGDVSERSYYPTLSELLVSKLVDIDPSRPYIRGSYLDEDLESGDTHTYLGSISDAASHYLDVWGRNEKLNTEFGVDAPPAPESLRYSRYLMKRLTLSDDDITGIQQYQSALVRYYIEYYRMRKYRSCSGYMQFMFIDLSPQSFYGIYDWWGIPKPAVLQVEACNQPVAVLLEHTDVPLGIWVVNDTLEDLGSCTVTWLCMDSSRHTIAQGSVSLSVCPDSLQRADWKEGFSAPVGCKVVLKLHQGDQVRARSIYDDPCTPVQRRPGHPARIDHEAGMRLF